MSAITRPSAPERHENGHPRDASLPRALGLRLAAAAGRRAP